MRLVLDTQVHLFQKLNHLQRRDEFDVVKLVCDRQVDAESLVLRSCHRVLILALFDGGLTHGLIAEEAIEHGVEQDEDFELGPLDRILLQGCHLPDQGPVAELALEALRVVVDDDELVLVVRVDLAAELAVLLLELTDVLAG